MAEITVPIKPIDTVGRLWMEPDIYTGPHGKGRYVPNKDDAVLSWATGLNRVTDVDVSTNLSTWSPVDLPNGGTNNPDELLGTVPGYQAESQRVYYDRSVTPHTLNIDTRIRQYGSTTSSVMIFLGTDISETNGKVIAYVLNAQGGKGSTSIPLELVGEDTINNFAIKAPVTAYTSEKLTDGEVVTVVAYRDGTVSSYQKMLIKDTTFSRKSSAAQRSITGITIESPYLSTTIENQFNIPIDTPVASISMTAWIQYSDGTRRSQRVDGSKMRMIGMENFVASVVSQKIPLVAVYYLDSNEDSTLTVEGVANRRHIPVRYTAVVTEADGASAVKLYMVPYWKDANVGWAFDWWLYSLDRKTYYYVTPYITKGVNSADFQPLLYNTRQRLTVAIDLAKVDSRFRKERHIQTFEITLTQDGLAAGDPWYLRYSVGQEPAYGQGISAKFKFGSVDDWGLKIDCGAKTQDAWLDALYYRTEPMYYTGVETRGLRPTHFAVVIADDVQPEYPISYWDQELFVRSGGDVGGGISIRWMYVEGDTTLYLGCSPMVIRHVEDYTEGTVITS